MSVGRTSMGDELCTGRGRTTRDTDRRESPLLGCSGGEESTIIVHLLKDLVVGDMCGQERRVTAAVKSKVFDG